MKAVIKMSEHKALAQKLFYDGYNCAQAVLLAFEDVTGLDKKTAAMLASSFGGGLGRMREVCGAVSGAAMAIGSICAATEGKDAESKKRNYELVREFAERFTAKNKSIICRELLSLSVKMEDSAAPEGRTAEYYKKRPCLKMVEDAAEIVMQLINENE